ncbi:MULTISPECIES: hypothetical protein [unclassified Clostridium]|uniref:hypothetical protein n=1 Tax=unclassified Clostridium TaxID=2614128 RepID=UPI0025BD9F8E|nr:MULTISPECIES: hypothetical protein [unclassified Clostridium]
MSCKYELRCTMKDRHCKECKHNPKAELQDYFRDRGYVPSCPHGYDDCIHDPAKCGKEEKCNCDDGCWYDDENK